MNIRSVSNPAQVQAKEKIEANKAIKSNETDEREANGQQPFSDPESHRSLTDEELNLVLKKIQDSDGIKKSGLLVTFYLENGQKIVKVETPDGQVVRRFVERDLYFFLYQSPDQDVHLVNKTA